MTRVMAVIVNWNCSRETVDVTRALLSEYPDLSVTIVDNASRDDEVALLGSELPDDRISVVFRQGNDGYGAGVNEVLLRAAELEVDWFWLINPDSRPRQGALRELIAQSDSAVAVGPRQVTGADQNDGGDTYASAVNVREGKARPFVCDGCVLGRHSVSVLTGTGMILRRSAVQQIPVMSEKFFHYKEEYEFIERLGSLGEVVYSCRAVVWHARGGSLSQSSPRAEYYRVRNEYLYLSMRSDRWRWQARSWRLVVRSLRDVAKAPSQEHGRARFRGALDGLKGRTGPL